MILTSLAWYTILFHYKWLKSNQSFGVEIPLILLLFCLGCLGRRFTSLKGFIKNSAFCSRTIPCEFESTFTYLNTQRLVLRPCHNFLCNLQRNGVALQVARKTSSCDTPCLQLVSQRKIAFQVAEKVEPASTFRNATRQAAACDIFLLYKLIYTCIKLLNILHTGPKPCRGN